MHHLWWWFASCVLQTLLIFFPSICSFFMLLLLSSSSHNLHERSEGKKNQIIALANCIQLFRWNIELHRLNAAFNECDEWWEMQTKEEKKSNRFRENINISKSTIIKCTLIEISNCNSVTQNITMYYRHHHHQNYWIL